MKNLLDVAVSVIAACAGIATLMQALLPRRARALVDPELAWIYRSEAFAEDLLP